MRITSYTQLFTIFVWWEFDSDGWRWKFSVVKTLLLLYCNIKPCAMLHFLSLSAFEYGKKHILSLPCRYYWIVSIFYLWAHVLLVCLYFVYYVKKRKKRITEKVLAFSSFMQLFANSVAKVYCKQYISCMMKISWTTNILSYNRFAVLLLYLQ